jgi:DNA repair exonuclease SbcCD ATPase subunit
MNTVTTELQEKVNELLAVLQKDLEHIERSIGELDELRALVIKRDDSGLSKLLEQIRSRSQEYEANQKLREELRQQIAEILDWPVSEVRLGKLVQEVTAEQRVSVRQMRVRLGGMISRLQREHTSTVMLLSDLSRFNSILLNTILQTGQVCGVTYDARGGTSRSGDVAFMNLQL